MNRWAILRTKSFKILWNDRWQLELRKLQVTPSRWKPTFIGNLIWDHYRIPFHWIKTSFHLCTLKIDFFQSRTWFFGNLSTHGHDTFHMEPFCDFRCIVNLSSGNCWVHYLAIKTEILLHFFSIFFIILKMCRFQIQHGNIIPLFLLMLCGIVAFTFVFFACELGQRVNDAFDEIKVTIDQFDWYSFPIAVQRMLPMIIAVAQKPVSLECFGSISWTREVFRQVSVEQQKQPTIKWNDWN